MKAAKFDYKRASSLDEAKSLVSGSDGSTRVLAGGQSLGPMMNLRLAQPSLLVDISRLDELRKVSDDADGLTVGAGVRHSAFEDGEVPDVANGLLQRVGAGIAYRAVRNRGTIGGSLAHADPGADWPPVMMALDAVLSVGSGAGQREIDAGQLVTGAFETALKADEIVESIRIPRLSAKARWGHYKVCRKPGEFADSLAIVVVDADRGLCHVVVASKSLSPIFLGNAEKVIGAIASWSDESMTAIKDAVGEDLKASGAALDSYDFNLHRVATARAAREAFAS